MNVTCAHQGDATDPKVIMISSEVISYYLSIITIAICFVLKTPQILSIYKKKSAVGLNINAAVMELCSYSVTAMYNYVNQYSILTYMEYPIILMQQIIMIYLMLKYKKIHDTPRVKYAAASYVFAVLMFSNHIIPPYCLNLLVPLTTPVSAMSKVAYMYEMIKEKSAETTSLLTWVISVSTNLFRIYTVMIDSGDKNLLFNFSISTLLSSAVLVTAMYYKRRANEKKLD